jgi:hypothetical protein
VCFRSLQIIRKTYNLLPPKIQLLVRRDKGWFANQLSFGRSALELIVALVILVIAFGVFGATISVNQPLHLHEVLCCLGEKPDCSTAVATWFAVTGAAAFALGPILTLRRDLKRRQAKNGLALTSPLITAVSESNNPRPKEVFIIKGQFGSRLTIRVESDFTPSDIHSSLKSL